MFPKQLSAFFIAIVLYGLSVTAAGADQLAGCTTISTGKIGKNGEVGIEKLQCPQDSKFSESKAMSSSGDAMNVCDHRCDTTCDDETRDTIKYTADDCDTLYRGLWFASQNQEQGNQITIGAGQAFKAEFNTCVVVVLNNYRSGQLEYCRNSLGTVTRSIGQCPFGGRCIPGGQNTGEAWKIVGYGQPRKW
ncbi:hypothetical protein MPER_11127 [Moniliophthora perniciosa FA553]|nr:hypothetical protein MPER_11127 [Moniliophthora perniciosa FA553]